MTYNENPALNNKTERVSNCSDWYSIQYPPIPSNMTEFFLMIHKNSFWSIWNILFIYLFNLFIHFIHWKDRLFIYLFMNGFCNFSNVKKKVYITCEVHINNFSCLWELFLLLFSNPLFLLLLLLLLRIVFHPSVSWWLSNWVRFGFMAQKPLPVI